MFCPNCGSQIAQDVTFCGNCGTKVNTQVPPLATPAAMPAQSVPGQPAPAQQMPVQPLPAQNVSQYPISAAPGMAAPVAGVNAPARKKIPFIPILLVVVVAIATALFVVPMFSSSSAYVRAKFVSFSSTSGDWTSTWEYTRSANGTLEAATYQRRDSVDMNIEYIDLGDGVACSSSETATYEKNANGDIVKITYSSDGETTSTQQYTYFSPGIIMTSTFEYKAGKYTRTYDLQGRLIEYLYEPSEDSGSSDKTHLLFTYQETDNGHTLLQTATSASDSEASDLRAFVNRYVLDVHGCPVQCFRINNDQEEVLISETTFVEVKDPAPYVRATTRLLD